MDLISRRTRCEFQEYMVTITLREIDRYFDNHNIEPSNTSNNASGARRTRVLEYYGSINWTDKKQVSQVLKVFADILFDLETKEDTWNPDFNKTWIDKLTKTLQRDGYQYANGKITAIGQVAQFEDVQNATDLLDKEHFNEYISRIRRSIDDDPGLAIGSTKELIEATLKTILTEMQVPFDKDDDIPKLLKSVQKCLDLVPEDVDDAKKGADIIKVLLSNLGQVVHKIAELRNLYGSGHGKGAKRRGLNERHARLIAGAGISLSTFLLETFELKKKEKDNASKQGSPT